MESNRNELQNVSSTGADSQNDQEKENSHYLKIISEPCKDINYLMIRVLSFTANQMVKIDGGKMSATEFLNVANNLVNIFGKSVTAITNLRNTLIKQIEEFCNNFEELKQNFEESEVLTESHSHFEEPNLADVDTREFPENSTTVMESDKNNVTVGKVSKRKFNLSLKKFSESVEESCSFEAMQDENVEKNNNLTLKIEAEASSLISNHIEEDILDNETIVVPRKKVISDNHSNSCETEDLNLHLDSDSEEKLISSVKDEDLDLPNSDGTVEIHPNIAAVKEEPVESNSDNSNIFKKCDFLCNLDLKPNLPVEKSEFLNDSDDTEDSLEQTEDCIQKLLDDSTSFYTSDSPSENEFVATSEEDSSDDIENEPFLIDPYQIPAQGRVVNMPLLLPDETCDDIPNDETITTKFTSYDQSNIKTKACSVVLYRVDDPSYVKTLSNEEERKLVMSCNFSVLKKGKKRRRVSQRIVSTSSSDYDSESEQDKRVQKKTKRFKSTKRTAKSSDSEYVPTDTDNSEDSSGNSHSAEDLPEVKPFIGASPVLFDPLDILNSDSDAPREAENGYKSDTSCSLDNVSKIKKKSSNKEQSKHESETEDELMGDEEDVSSRNVDNSWKRDPLLIAPIAEPQNKLNSGKDENGKSLKLSTEQLEAPTGATDILPRVVLDRIDETNIRRAKRKENAQNGLDSDDTFCSELEDSDATDPDQNSEDGDSSEIEFFEASQESVKKKASDSIVVKSSDEDEEITLTPSKTGRRNIREILPESLETLQIRKKEEDRLQRLSQLQQYRESYSQASLGEELVLDIDQDTGKPLVRVHPVLVNRMKNHQKEGVKFMWNACFESLAHMKEDPEGSGCLLAHCMGLGKTFQIVSLVHTLFVHPDTNVKHVLIVCPLSTVPNWVNEFKIGLDHLDAIVSIYSINERHKNKDEKLAEVQKWYKNSGVLLMGYETFTSLIKSQNLNYVNKNALFKALCNPGPDLLVCDEGHNLKNGKTNRYKSLGEVNTKRKIILTGTPLQNNLKEYYHMVQFVKPNLLGSIAEFANRFANPIENGQFANSTSEDIRRMKRRSHVLHDTLVNTMQRFERAELEKYLRGKSDYVVFIKLHPVQVSLYKQYVKLFVEEGTQNPIKHFPNMQILWTHPRILSLASKQKRAPVERDTVIFENLSTEGVVDLTEKDNDWWGDICPEDFMTNLDYGPKFKVMLEIIAECEKVGDKLLIFSSRLGELDAIEYFLQEVGTPQCPSWKPNQDYFRMDGTVPPLQRHELCNKFNDKNDKIHRVFLVSRGVGGLGLNLVGANRVIIMDVNFNPSADSQSVMRVYRFGQDKMCFVYRLVAMGTMEEVIYERCVTKLAIAGRVVDEKQIERHFKADEIAKMFRCRVNFDEERPVPKLPGDKVLATILDKLKVEVYKYLEHQALLENLPDEELDEQERKEAWAEFKRERDNQQNEFIRRLAFPPTTEQINGNVIQTLQANNAQFPTPSTSGYNNYNAYPLTVAPTTSTYTYPIGNTSSAPNTVITYHPATPRPLGNQQAVNMYKQSLQNTNFQNDPKVILNFMQQHSNTPFRYTGGSCNDSVNSSLQTRPVNGNNSLANPSETVSSNESQPIDKLVELVVRDFRNIAIPTQHLQTIAEQTRNQPDNGNANLLEPLKISILAENLQQKLDLERLQRPGSNSKSNIEAVPRTYTQHPVPFVNARPPPPPYSGPPKGKTPINFNSSTSASINARRERQFPLNNRKSIPANPPALALNPKVWPYPIEPYIMPANNTVGSASNPSLQRVRFPIPNDFDSPSSSSIVSAAKRIKLVNNGYRVPSSGGDDVGRAMPSTSRGGNPSTIVNTGNSKDADDDQNCIILE